MARTRLFESSDIIACGTQLLCVYALLPENSGLINPFVRNMPDFVFLVLHMMGMVPPEGWVFICCERNRHSSGGSSGSQCDYGPVGQWTL